MMNCFWFCVYKFFLIIVEFLSLFFLPLISMFSRLAKRNIDVGLGPDPLINNVYFSEALKYAGFSSETFVNNENYITDNYDKIFCRKKMHKVLKFIYLSLGVYLYTIYNYKCIYIYMNGLSLCYTWAKQYRWYILPKLEPVLYKIANIRIVAMAYGGDVYTYESCNSLYYRYLMHKEYPEIYVYEQQKKIKQNIIRWWKYADCIVNGGDNVYYLPFCGDIIRTNFLCIDTDEYKEIYPKQANDKLVITHVVNHRDIKGSQFFEKAISELQHEGLNIEFINLLRVPGEVARQAIEKADIVADQLILGTYGMTAIQAMAMGKPTLCYFDPKLEEFMIIAGHLEEAELPIIKCTPFTVKEAIKKLYFNREELIEIAHRSRLYVEKHHSISAGADLMREINEKIGLKAGI